MRHLDNMAKIMLATGLMVAYGYMMEVFMAWYSGNSFEQVRDGSTACSGPTRSCYWAADRCATCLVPQLLWFKQVRTNVPWCCSSSRSW